MLFAERVGTIPPVIVTPPDVQRIDGMISPEPSNVRPHVYCIISNSAAVFPDTSTDDVNGAEIITCIITGQPTRVGGPD